MIEVKVTVIPQCSDGDIKHWIQFFSDIENVEKAPHQAMQNDILFYLNSLKYFKDRAEEMQKTLEWYASNENWGSIEELGAFVSDGGERARQALKGEALSTSVGGRSYQRSEKK